ncbi:hypothetical protein BU26DRAFT_588277 [Trematosphaeria pertusa]|uniref:Uncharacterized protein n=1 Tax=Trematosphaeria pertusa TaxID=390896 RepID=A0A6A6ITE5_9PLEO|nr:uncharacterized protein BU26DRAFT_588277 [Trematosphaeria pertusa]KAF2253377.1 hypothetical protein BU26DRAFT_588277 [Trematosphaeria pertusa]
MAFPRSLFSVSARRSVSIVKHLQGADRNLGPIDGAVAVPHGRCSSKERSRKRRPLPPYQRVSHNVRSRCFVPPPGRKQDAEWRLRRDDVERRPIAGMSPACSLHEAAQALPITPGVTSDPQSFGRLVRTSSIAFRASAHGMGSQSRTLRYGLN